ncbi:MAG TPA: V-type ATPase 116kDa subunit family protein [Candidatus Thermoplasmatota archaeon]|nr:V-type ATPase 116kDa subunit family protein [Candidatus Thermoplasmatota archaeon]
MALQPEPMQRALIVASKAYQPSVIETLHALRAAHFIDFSEQKEGEFSDFRLGKPLPEGDAASGRLVRVRALLRHLSLEGAHTDATTPQRELEGALDTRLDGAEADVSRAVEHRETLRNSLAEGKELEAKLAPLAALPLKIEDYSGYDTLQVFVGRADPAFRVDLPRVAPDHELVTGEGELFALFVPKAKAAEVSDLLYRHGYAEIEVPAGAGAPAEKIREIQSERATLDSRLAKADADLARLAGEHKDLLLAAEEHLSIQVEKAEAPLAFASTDHAFVVDTWIPMGAVAEVEAAVQKATRDNVYFARLETSADVSHNEAHHHDEGHAGADAAFNAHASHAAPKALPPTRYNNAGATKRFEWFTDLFSTPRYNEVDPTAMFAIFFPLFFGFMIGDLGLGLIMCVIGWLLMTKLPRVDGMKQLGTAILIAGIIAAALGGLVFKDALGIPLGFTSHMEEELTAEGLVPACSAAVYEAVHETNWGCLLGGNVVHAEPLINKVQDLNTMLLLSVIAALVHLLIGLLFGLRNEWGHGGKHVAAKFGYLILLLTFFPAVVALLRQDMFVGGTPLAEHAAVSFHMPITQAQAYMTAGVGFVVGAVILGWAEGFGGVLEIPSMFSAIMSYLRLGAVAIAKGAMALAFNNLTLVAALTGGGLILVLGLIGFVVAQIALLVLGLLSGGIQALRLNFVEFFTKFYKGGGTPYKPFGRERVYTAPTAAQGAAVSSVMIKP